jgi:hypothetical protein
MATQLMIAGHQALALIFSGQEQLERWRHRVNRIRDWRTLFHVFLPTNAPQGLTPENMMATSTVPCSQEYTDHETDEMRLHPPPLQCSHQHDVVKRDLKMRSYSTCPFLQSASNQVPRLEVKQPHRRCVFYGTQGGWCPASPWIAQPSETGLTLEHHPQRKIQDILLGSLRHCFLEFFLKSS